MCASFAGCSSRRWAVALAVAFAGCVRPDSVCATQEQRQVLLLYSTRRDAQLVSVVDRQIPRILADGLSEDVDFYSEYVDQARFPDPRYEAAFRDFLKLKYREQQFDVVVTMQDAATEFLVRNRNDLFRQTPLVFVANSVRPRPENSTGIVTELNLAGTLALAAALQPRLRHVFVVSGAAARDQAYEALARAQLQPFQASLSVTYLSGLPARELENRLATLPPNSIVYFLLVYRDGAGENFHPLEFLDRVTAVANAPTYCWVDSAIGHGVVGGKLRDQEAQAHAVASLALRVLRGEHADSIPVSSPDLDVSQVDWRQLRRWGISEARIPHGTVVRFREPSVWSRYRAYILGAMAVMFAQMALIAGLLVQRTRLRRAEEKMRGSEAQLRTSSGTIRDLGSRLLNAQETERARIARELHDDIGQQLGLLTIDLELLDCSDVVQAKSLAAEALRRAYSVTTSVHDLSHRLHPAKLRLLGLVSAVEALQRELSQSELSVTFTHDTIPPTLSPELTLCLFRVVQEALQNAVKYSKATHVAVHLEGSVQGLALTIIDNGVGFDVSAEWGKGLGLISMRERLDAIGGTLEIQSARGVGTRLDVRAPVTSRGPTKSAVVGSHVSDRLESS
jgi:signal transduction histidine kinase